MGSPGLLDLRLHVVADRSLRPSRDQWLWHADCRSPLDRSLCRHHDFVSPVYLAEISKREKRGQLIIIQQLTIGMNELVVVETKVR